MHGGDGFLLPAEAVVEEVRILVPCLYFGFLMSFLEGMANETIDELNWI